MLASVDLNWTYNTVAQQPEEVDSHDQCGVVASLPALERQAD